jgi:hypothetical protein
MPSDHGLADPFAPNSVWASSDPTGAEFELTTPTGQTCRAKKMSIEAMLAAGLLAEADAITAAVSKHMKKARPGGKQPKKDAEPDIDVPSLMKDPKAIGDLVQMLDTIIPHVVVSPIVKLHYKTQTVGKTTVTKMLTEEQRSEIRAEQPDQVIVFTDQIGLEDKMFLFDWSAGGLGTMLAFRR